MPSTKREYIHDITTEMKDKKVQNYTLLRPLGQGGMAEVWYAENALGVAVAVKVLKEEYKRNESVLARFASEAKVMVALNHPNIRRVLDTGEVDGRPAIILEYLEGEDLGARLARGERFSSQQLQNLWNTLVDALGYTHSKGVVHRDIKPSNIFLTTSGSIPKLLDFGIAKQDLVGSLTQTGNFMGTTIYASPEQIRDSKHLDYRSDAYSLAVTFYHLLMGVAPYDSQAESTFDIQRRIVEQPLDLSSLPEPWRTELGRYLHKQPEDRATLMPMGGNEQTLVEAPSLWARGAESAQPVPSPVPTAPSAGPMPTALSPEPVAQPRRHRGRWIALSVAGLLLLGGGGYYWSKVWGSSSDSSVEQSDLRGISTGEDDADYAEVLARAQQRYDYVGSFVDGLALVGKDGKWGFINTDGQEQIPLRYDDLNPFSEGLADVRLGGKWGFVNAEGKVVIPIKYEFVYPFEDGKAYVQSEDWHYIDKQGRRIE